MSVDRFERRVMNPMPAIMARAPTAAPRMPGIPRSMAMATPGRTPWARASPMNASPRSTMRVPTMPQATETRKPASRAFAMNGFAENGTMNVSNIIGGP